MNRPFSTSAIDRLGDRLRSGKVADDDLRLLDSYRRSFAAAYDRVTTFIRMELDLEPTGRPAKSTKSIVEKLDRETIRLSQMQDIAGCRLLVHDVAAQEYVSESLLDSFPEAVLVDRRDRPSHGYRAVHVIVSVDGLSVEIQIRTRLQHLWAELSEKFSDVFDPAIKYGGGNADLRDVLETLTQRVMTVENGEKPVGEAETAAALRRISAEKQELLDFLETIIAKVAKRRRPWDALPDSV